MTSGSAVSWDPTYLQKPPLYGATCLLPTATEALASGSNFRERLDRDSATAFIHFIAQVAESPRLTLFTSKLVAQEESTVKPAIQALSVSLSCLEP